MKITHLFKLLSALSLALLLGWLFPMAHIKADNVSTLGKYPVCEPSAVVKVTCPESEGNCLLVADNEQKDALFLYSVSSKQLDSTRQSQLALEKKISDIEAIAKLDDNKVLLFGSHSRNNKCEIKANRQRFVQAQLSGNQLKIIGKLIQSSPINSQVLFQDLDVNSNKIISAVSRAIDEAETQADQSLGDKNRCEQANAFNAEGAVAIPDPLSLEKFKIWIGLRSPVVTLDANNYAVLLKQASDNTAAIQIEALKNKGELSKQMAFEYSSLKDKISSNEADRLRDELRATENKSLYFELKDRHHHHRRRHH